MKLAKINISKASSAELEAENERIDTLEPRNERDEEALMAYGEAIQDELDKRESAAEMYPKDIPRDQLDYPHNAPLEY